MQEVNKVVCRMVGHRWGRPSILDTLLSNTCTRCGHKWKDEWMISEEIADWFDASRTMTNIESAKLLIEKIEKDLNRNA